MAPFRVGEHAREVQVVSLGHALGRAANLLDVDLLVDLEDLVDVLGVELVVPQPVDHLHVVDDGLPEVGGVDVVGLVPVGVVGHVEGELYLAVQGFHQGRQELRVQVEGVEVPRKLLDVLNRVLLVVEVLVLLKLVRPMLLEHLLLFCELIRLYLVLFIDLFD